jgi:hypothetical protein
MAGLPLSKSEMSRLARSAAEEKWGNPSTNMRKANATTNMRERHFFIGHLPFLWALILSQNGVGRNEVNRDPIEPHGFREPTSWLDGYRRILKLFETHLK